MRILLVVWHCKSTNHSTLFHCLHGWLHTLRVRHLIIRNTLSTNSNKSITQVSYSTTNCELLWKSLGGSSSIRLLSKSLKWGYVLDLGWQLTSCALMSIISPLLPAPPSPPLEKMLNFTSIFNKRFCTPHIRLNKDFHLELDIDLLSNFARWVTLFIRCETNFKNRSYFAI